MRQATDTSLTMITVLKYKKMISERKIILPYFSQGTLLLKFYNIKRLIAYKVVFQSTYEF